DNKIMSPVSLIHYLKKFSFGNLKLHLIQMRENDFLDYSSAAQKLNFKSIPFSKVVFIEYNKHSEVILYKLKFSDSHELVNLLQETPSRRVITKNSNQTKTIIEYFTNISIVREKPPLNNLIDKAA